VTETLLKIAGITARVSTDPALLDSFLVRTGAYATRNATQDLTLEVHSVDAYSSPRPIRAVFPASDAAVEQGRFRFWRRDFRVELIPGNPAVAEAWCESGFGIAVENVLRLCLSILIPLRGGLMLHASAIARDGLGFVFTGLSGAGKSTIIKLIGATEGTRSLGDEVTILLPTDQGFQVHSTPFGGELAPVPPGTAPLRRLFYLTERALPTDAATRAARLLRNALVLASDATIGDALIAGAHRVVTNVECRALFRPTPGALEQALRP
jgi:hypothetical protein